MTAKDAITYASFALLVLGMIVAGALRYGHLESVVEFYHGSHEGFLP